MPIRVVVVDDHPVILAGIQQALEGESGIDVVAYLRSSTELVEYMNRSTVDVILTDYSMPSGRYGDGIAMIRFVRRRFSTVKIALLTAIESGALLKEAMNAGVHALVGKGDDYSGLADAIRSASQGTTFVSPKIAEALSLLPVDGPREQRLSKRESEVIRMLAEGLTLSEIGARIGRSHKTVGTQKLSAMRKLGLRSDADIYHYAIAHGMVQASEAGRQGHAPGE